MLRCLCAALALVWWTGCAHAYLMRADNTPDPAPSPVLITGFAVEFDHGPSGPSLVDALQNGALADFGAEVAEVLQEHLASFGFIASYDATRTVALDRVQLSSSAATAAFTGTWRHPEASSWTPRRVESLFVSPVDVIARVRQPGARGYFGFVGVSVSDHGLIMKEPTVVVTVSIYDESGNKVLALQGVGAGDAQLLLSDRSPLNLSNALKRAMLTLAAATTSVIASSPALARPPAAPVAAPPPPTATPQVP